MNEPATRCCPEARRRHGLRTRDGLPVYDLHRHDRGWRGYTVERGQKRYAEWYANGRVTPLAETGGDVLGVSK